MPCLARGSAAPLPGGRRGAIVFAIRNGRLYEVPSLGGVPRLRLEPVVVRNLAGPDSGITIVQNWLAEFAE